MVLQSVLFDSAIHTLAIISSQHYFVDKIHNLKQVEYTHNPSIRYSAGVGTEVKSLEVQGVSKYSFSFSLCASKFIVFCCRSLPPSTGIPSEGKEHAARIPYSQLDCLWWTQSIPGINLLCYLHCLTIIAERMGHHIGTKHVLIATKLKQNPLDQHNKNMKVWLLY